MCGCTRTPSGIPTPPLVVPARKRDLCLWTTGRRHLSYVETLLCLCILGLFVFGVVIVLCSTVTLCLYDRRWRLRRWPTRVGETDGVSLSRDPIHSLPGPETSSPQLSSSHDSTPQCVRKIGVRVGRVVQSECFPCPDICVYTDTCRSRSFRVLHRTSFVRRVSVVYLCVNVCRSVGGEGRHTCAYSCM